MLRRTTTTAAAYGVLAIFLLLLSVSQGVPVAGEVEETPVEETTVLPTSTASAIKVENLTFADSIRNPCPTYPSGSSRINSVAESRRMEFAIEFYKTVRDTSRRYQEDFQEMLNSSLFKECFVNRNLQNIPSLSDLQTMSESDALESMYFSILLHTAYAYFVPHQLRSYSDMSCSSVGGHTEMLNRTFQEIATKQKYLACFFHMGATVMGYAQNFTAITEQVLDETMTDLQLCSRRNLRDCQVLKSTINLLGVIKEYATSRSQNRRTLSSGSTNLTVHISGS